MSEKVCPSCGYCQECGRGRTYPYPYQYYIWYGTTTTGTVPVSGNVSSPLNGTSWTQAIQNLTPTKTESK